MTSMPEPVKAAVSFRKPSSLVCRFIPTSTRRPSPRTKTSPPSIICAVAREIDDLGELFSKFAETGDFRPAVLIAQTSNQEPVANGEAGIAGKDLTEGFRLRRGR